MRAARLHRDGKPLRRAQERCDVRWGRASCRFKSRVRSVPDVVFSTWDGAWTQTRRLPPAREPIPRFTNQRVASWRCGSRSLRLVSVGLRYPYRTRGHRVIAQRPGNMPVPPRSPAMTDAPNARNAKLPGESPFPSSPRREMDSRAGFFGIGAVAFRAVRHRRCLAFAPYRQARLTQGRGGAAATGAASFHISRVIRHRPSDSRRRTNSIFPRPSKGGLPPPSSTT